MGEVGRGEAGEAWKLLGGAEAGDEGMIRGEGDGRSGQWQRGRGGEEGEEELKGQFQHVGLVS